MDAAREFKEHFPDILLEYDLNQIFNADETGLCYRLLPQKTLAHANEKKADGMKKAKDRVTLSACANITGSIKLPLLFIGKAKRPRCYAGVNMDSLPVTYRNSANAWVTSEIFYQWFHEVFVPFVGSKLIEMGLEPKAMLILDNCLAHPDVEQLTSRDGKIKAEFLPANVTPLIQPMDQGVLECLKRIYRQHLLRDLISHIDTEMIPFLRSFNMRDVVDRTALAWEQVSRETLQKSWDKLMPAVAHDEDDELEIEIAPAELMLHDLQLLDPTSTVGDVHDWFSNDGPGYEHMDDQGIVEFVKAGPDGPQEITSDDDEHDVLIVEQPIVCPVTNAEAMQAFEKGLVWLRHQKEATSVNTATLLNLRELAAQKRESARKQSTIHNFLNADCNL